MPAIIVTGRPGSGKGTQAELLASQLQIPHISTGDIFRDHMARRTPLGVQITESMNAGKYTSDAITNEVIRERLNEDDAKNGYILDGYPRTLNQVEFLDSINVHIDMVVDLDVDEEVAVRRLLLRAETQQRGDDDEAVIRDRMKTYEATVTPVVEAYSLRHILHVIPAEGTVEEINLKVQDVLG